MSYDEKADEAKANFLRDLEACPAVRNRRGSLKVNLIAELVEMSPPTVSKFTLDPHRISENFIRLVAQNVPGMELSYAKFRLYVDRDFIPYPMYQVAMEKEDVATSMMEVFELLEGGVEFVQRVAAVTMREKLGGPEGGWPEPGRWDTDKFYAIARAAMAKDRGDKTGHDGGTKAGQ
jgi:hypothetical protein